ncbi:MAG: hypothetical protein AB8B80_15250 [Marinicellaceae bacterium]
MSFLEELEQNKQAKKTEDEKTPRQLWESCFKYFKHFVSILQKEKNSFEADFNFTFLNITTKCLISGPFEIKRTQDDKNLKLEITLTTQLRDPIKIKRKDQRSSELLRSKLLKDNILSQVKIDKNNQNFIELNSTIPSIFRLILKDENDFFIEYKNLSSSANRTIKLSIDKINQDYMDELAKYILGKNPGLYTESISDKEISKIRDKIALEKKILAKRKEKLRAIAEQEKLEEEERIANTLKEKSKRYLFSKSKILKNKIIDKINNLKQ